MIPPPARNSETTHEFGYAADHTGSVDEGALRSAVRPDRVTTVAALSRTSHTVCEYPPRHQIDRDGQSDRV